MPYHGQVRVRDPASERLPMPAAIDRNEMPEIDRASANAAMARYAAGDNSAFSDVYDAVAPVVFDQMLTLTEDSALAEELTQRVLLRLHKARGRFLRQADVGTWALAIAERVAVENALGLDAPTPSLVARARRAFEALFSRTDEAATSR